MNKKVGSFKSVLAILICMLAFCLNVSANLAKVTTIKEGEGLLVAMGRMGCGISWLGKIMEMNHLNKDDLLTIQIGTIINGPESCDGLPDSDSLRATGVFLNNQSQALSEQADSPEKEKELILLRNRVDQFGRELAEVKSREKAAQEKVGSLTTELSEANSTITKLKTDMGILQGRLDNALTELEKRGKTDWRVSVPWVLGLSSLFTVFFGGVIYLSWRVYFNKKYVMVKNVERLKNGLIYYSFELRKLIIKRECKSCGTFVNEDEMLKHMTEFHSAPVVNTTKDPREPVLNVPLISNDMPSSDLSGRRRSKTTLKGLGVEPLTGGPLVLR